MHRVAGYLQILEYIDDAFNEKEIKLSEEEVQLTLTKFRQEFQQKQREIAQRKAQEAAAAERS